MTAAYNTADQLTRLVGARPTGTGAFRWVFGSGRDALGRVSAASDRVGGTRHQYSYDPLGRVTQDQRSNRTAESWTYDAADQLKTEQDAGTGLSTSAGYDNGGQLTSFQKTVNGTTTQNLSFGFNANGGRTQQTDSVSSVQTTYPELFIDSLEVTQKAPPGLGWNTIPTLPEAPCVPVCHTHHPLLLLGPASH